MENKVLDVINYDRLKKMFVFTFKTIDEKIDLYKDTLSQSDVENAIDKTFYEDFDKAILCYKKAIGNERFNKLIEKHRLHGDPQSVILYAGGRGDEMKNKSIEQMGGGDLKLQFFKDIRDLCHRVNPSEDRMREVSERVITILDK
jgi:hypothetical protein